MNTITVKETITGTVIRIIRHGHTVYGNPKLSVLVDHSTDEPGQGGLGAHLEYRISDNASLVYEIENAEFKDEPHTFALTRAGRISHVIA